MKHVIFSTLFAIFLTASVAAQFDFRRTQSENETYIGGPRLGDSKTQIWRAGLVIEPGASMENIQISIPVPMEWREQRILSVNEEKMEANLASQIVYHNSTGGAMEMKLQLRSLTPTRPVEIVVAFELQNYELLPPENPEQYAIPASRNRVPPAYRQYLQPSPTIESQNPRFAQMFKEITRDRKTDWDKVEALYSFVQNNVKYDDQAWRRPAKGALALINMPRGEWTADCKDMCCLFVALCRAGGIPARIVRVPEHCYAEFYLEIKQEDRARNNAAMGFWFPCQVSGTYSFGGIPETRVILQKGDSFPEYGNPRARRLFTTEDFQGSLVPGSPPPRPRWVREVIAK